MNSIEKNIYWKVYFKWNDGVTKQDWINFQFEFFYVPSELVFLTLYSVRLHSSCRTDLGRSIKMATDNLHSLGVVNRFTGSQPYQLPQQPFNQKDTHLKICK